MDDFLKELKAHGSADLNSLMATLNDGDLCRETLQRWIESGWVRVAPHSPLTALQGPQFSEDLTLSEFCGRGTETAVESGDDAKEAGAAGTERQEHQEEQDEHS